MIDPKKTYKTRDGREVRIYAVDGGGDYPVHGAILDGDEWEMANWSLCGRRKMPYSVHANEDLIEAKPRIQREVWVNVYRNGVEAYSSKHAADYNVEQIRIACVKLTIDCEEGHGLD